LEARDFSEAHSRLNLGRSSELCGMGGQEVGGLLGRVWALLGWGGGTLASDTKKKKSVIKVICTLVRSLFVFVFVFVFPWD
jgi:hypothetical protein